MTIKEKLELREEQILAPYATKSKNTKGRAYPISPCDMRTDFCRDRDRILHSKAFRRLKHKTQVFIQPTGDHYRTRLTHTLEVSQIARTISRSLFLNEDLTEAIALGHDLGHTPFGHEGERALDALSPRGFRHNEQSLRVVRFLEGDRGLNLTAETEDGIVCHTGPVQPSTPEGCVVRLSDKIAYINHDIDDAVRAQIISPDDLPKEAVALFGKTGGERIDAMIKNAVAESVDGKIAMSRQYTEAMAELEAFMFRNVYIDSVAKEEEKKVLGILSGIYERSMKQERFAQSEDPDRAVCDYIAGMTDSYCVEVYKKLFIPTFWEKI